MCVRARNANDTVDRIVGKAVVCTSLQNFHLMSDLRVVQRDVVKVCRKLFKILPHEHYK